MGSLSDIVAVALLAELFTVTCDDRSPPTVPSVTVKDSDVSDSIVVGGGDGDALRRARGAVRREGHRA